MKSQKVVGYFISVEEKTKITTTPGGGGDKISYHIAKDLEYPFYRVLSERYSDVKTLSAPPTPEQIKSDGLSLVFMPRFSSNSSGSSVLIWPADQFSIALNCKVYDENGELLLEKNVVGNGAATNSELTSNFALSANRAAEAMFNQLRTELAKDPALQ